jgi:hypothetical protein
MSDNERAPLDQRESFLICTWSCSAAGYDPTACAQYGCQALKGERMDSRQYTDAPTTAGRDSFRADDRAHALRTAVPAEQNPLSVLEQGYEEARKRISDQTDRVRQLADHLFGGEPERGSNGSKIPEAPPRMGRSGALLDQSEALHRALGYLDAQLDRLIPLAK